MRIGTVVLALVVAVSLAIPVEVVLAASNPIPGVGIVVKRHPGTSARVTTPAGFFGPGSQAFDGSVAMEGSCSHACGGCDNDCAGNEGNPDGRMDYAADAPTGPFDASMAPTTMYSTAPIEVSIDGVSSFFDVSVAVGGQGPTPGPAAGTVVLLPGESLDVGSSAHVLDSSFDVHCTITFADATTHAPAGSSIEQDFHITLQDAGLSITRIADGTPDGRIALGMDGAYAAVPFTYSSAGGDLVMKLLSLYPSSPVPVKATSWGAVKALYR